MEPRVPAIKLSHALLRDTISVIAKWEGDRESMDKEIYQLHISNSKRPKPPSFKNATRAVTYPSLRHLGLIYGEGSSIKLTGPGAQLLQGLKESDDAYTRALAIHIVRWDQSSLKLLDKIKGILETGKDATIEKLVDAYWRKNPKRNVSMDLARLLSFYEDARLIDSRDGILTLNSGQIETSRNPLHVSPTNDEFTRVLVREYLNEVRSGRSPLVPIPVIERRVCAAFRGRLWSDEFRKILASLPKETDTYVIHFGQPMTRESQGLRIGGQYFYYIQIRTKVTQ